MKTSQENLASFSFQSTGLNPCPYRPAQMERKIITNLEQGASKKYHDLLSKVGFRRSHRVAYATACPECNACIPVRIRVSDFKHGKTFRRVMRYNKDLKAIRCPPIATYEQHQLFMDYQNHRHLGGDMALMSFTDYKDMIEETPIETFIYEFRKSDESLTAAALVDSMADGLSAVYSFFDSREPKRSLGTYVVLSLIELCQNMNLPYLYLGYYISDCTKMSYKTNYRPLEAFGQNGWQEINNHDKLKK